MSTKTRVAFVVLLAVISTAGFQYGIAVGSEKATSGSQLGGNIFGPDGTTPLAGVQVKAYHLSTEQVFTSAPTDQEGRYEFTGLPEGYFDIAVETTDGLFVCDQIVDLGSAKATLSLALKEAEPGAEIRQFVGSTQQPSGVASVQQSGTSGRFWRSRAGTATIVSSGALALLALGEGGGAISQSSP